VDTKARQRRRGERIGERVAVAVSMMSMVRRVNGTPFSIRVSRAICEQIDVG